MRRPRIRADFVPVRLSGEAEDYLVMVGETRHLLIEDPVAADVVDLIDGRTELADTVSALSARYPAARVATSLRRLHELDLLTDGETATTPEIAAAWDARRIDPDRAERVLRAGQLTLVDATTPPGDIAPTGAARQLASALTDFGLTVQTHCIEDPQLAAELARADAGLVVAAVATPTDARLAALNDTCLALGRGWTMVRPQGSVLMLGPHFVPGQTGCWQCLRTRWAENEPVVNYVAARSPARPRVNPAIATLPATIAVLAGLLATELPVLAALGRSPRITGRMVALDTRDLTTEHHILVALPSCASCATPAPAAGRVELRPAPVAVSPDGGSRSVPALQTYQRLSHHISRYLGVVTRLEPLHGGGELAHTFGAGHNFAQPRGPAMLRTNLRGLSGGKGRTELQAKVSAIGEAVERYCGVWRDDRPVHRATYRDLGPDRAVHLNELLGFSAAQYADRLAGNALRGHFHRVPTPMADDAPLDWTTGWSLTHERARELPAAYCWYGHPDLYRADVCSADSNGCAAGNTLPEAVLQGFCELVERDAVAMWWYHRSRLPGVDLASFADPWIDALRVDYERRLGRRLWALDLTADLGIPVFAAVSARTDWPTEDVLLGFGAHLDPAVALSRALTEMNQFVPMVIREAGDQTRYGVREPDTLHWFRSVRVAEQDWLRPAPDAAPTTASTHRSVGGHDAADDVRHCVDLAAGAGLDVIVVDQSRADIELPVVKVIVPGLRHFWRRLGPGRLWQVPAALGRSNLAADEAAMNPLSVFF